MFIGSVRLKTSCNDCHYIHFESISQVFWVCVSGGSSWVYCLGNVMCIQQVMEGVGGRGYWMEGV